MCCNSLRCHIICWMLYRCKCIDILTKRKNYDTSRMLPRSPVNSNAALGYSVNLTFTFVNFPLFKIFLNISVCRFFCNGSYCTCTEGLSFTKYNLRVLMRLTLVLTGEVKVNIRLFISLKTEECLKGNIKSRLNKGFTTVRTYSVRHITS